VFLLLLLLRRGLLSAKLPSVEPCAKTTLMLMLLVLRRGLLSAKLPIVEPCAKTTPTLMAGGS
jgi:hypothetical protein